MKLYIWKNKANIKRGHKAYYQEVLNIINDSVDISESMHDDENTDFGIMLNLKSFADFKIRYHRHIISLHIALDAKIISDDDASRLWDQLNQLRATLKQAPRDIYPFSIEFGSEEE